ncbi:MAG: helix-turn-helix transcriptional regulator [Bacteroidota bacterium]
MITKGKSIHNKAYSIMITMLREKREDKQITQADLAELIGVDQTIISKIENRERRLDVIELRMICKAMDYSFIDFISELEQKIESKKR